MQMQNPERAAGAYVACVPHVPLLSLQEKAQNPGLWAAYDERIREFEAFDPDLIIAFGGDHYSNLHLNLMPTFAIGFKAEAINDCGGTPGALDVPMTEARSLAAALVEDGFDPATSHDMKVDHGFSNVLGFFLHGELAAKPVIPIFINSHCEPRPTLKRCRELGAAIGRWAAASGKRVAILGSGGLSHETSFIFPQFDTAPNEDVRDFIVTGGGRGSISQHKWLEDIRSDMGVLSSSLIAGDASPSNINATWDRSFLETFTAGDLTAFDRWNDEDILKLAGYGGGEVRMWIAAAAAGAEAGATQVRTDYYSDETTLAIGIGVAHAQAA